ncbi:GWT1-domain-containing protein [Phlebopus sp. FC_14]|nr:GWT1-domain-containing protein [Phlebopus sp. FC_14]
MDNDYKASKEAFVSGTTGSTVLHINTICAVALSSVALHSALRSRIPGFQSIPFPLEWLILVAPLLLSMTLYAQAPGPLSILLLVPPAVLLLLPPIEKGTLLPSRVSETQFKFGWSNSNAQSRQPEISLRPLPPLTTYRAHMMLMTILSILAVDFPVFPRSLAKCETYGVSLMDLGVGSFVFSQGIISAIPLIKNPSCLTAPLKPKLSQTCKKIAPLFVLALMRVLLVKGTEYPEHVTEYGVHWNFFLTLAILPAVEVLLHPIIIHFPIALVGLWIGVLQQVVLSLCGLEHFLLNAPRSNFVYANKEGLISLSGYLSIHVMGLSLGTIILPPSPSYFRKQQALLAKGEDKHNSRLDPSASRQDAKTIVELFSYSAVWWILLEFIQFGLNVSRRMANLPYILWTVAFNTSFILGYYLIEMLFFPTHISRSKDPSDPTGKRLIREDHRSSKVNGAPLLLEAINKNGLVLFLIANVATGLINFFTSTIYTSNVKAMFVLGGYSFGLCAFACTFGHRRIWRM